jgi:pimeloyl-ACP methyl ester carboxylesterase
MMVTFGQKFFPAGCTGPEERNREPPGMPIRFESLPAGDGRSLDVLLGGAASGPALIAHHGTPSDASLWDDWDGVAAANGLRLISISRPGYASSTRQPGRRVASVVDDVTAVIDRLDVPWFVTAGWSGGGPHALACGALLPDRCRKVATLAGVGAYGQPDLDFLAGMGPENHAEFGAALEGEPQLRAWLEANAEEMRHVDGPSIAAAFGGLVPQIDKDVLSGGFADRLATTMRRGLAGGFDGWVDDDFVFVNDWGFDLAALRIPVTVWQGDLDLMVPFAHGAWLAKHIPTATKRDAPGHGHISLIAAYRDAIVADLLSARAR